MEKYDVIVVGGGHAGVEAALSSARMNQKTLIVTANLNNLASTPCNPNIGGSAKGIVTREIDALGGQQGKNADNTQIQMRLLNTSKGPAIRALRAQIDKELYPKEMLDVVLNTPNLKVLENFVSSLIIEDGVCFGVVLDEKTEIYSSSVIITTGTYMSSKIIMGSDISLSGPKNEKTSTSLSKQLESLGIKLFRLKTGTPPRIHKDSMNTSTLEEHVSDEIKRKFSFDPFFEPKKNPEIYCFLTYTNEKTHKIINDNLHRSGMYSGTIEGHGPRYCPSIEDKLVRFSDKKRHQLFLEPETIDGDTIYVQGLSTSMPKDVQELMVHSIEGLEDAQILSYGYAIEYDAVIPTQLNSTLEFNSIKNLFSAGQINGTSGYEEAAGQGIIAGINAALKSQNKDPFILGRNEAYIGVMIDDLVTKGTLEPYRLLTSRAEYRLLLRSDNADMRLTKYGHEFGLISDERFNHFIQKTKDIDSLKAYLEDVVFMPKDITLKNILEATPNRSYTGIELLKRPDLTLKSLILLDESISRFSLEVQEQVEIQVKYDGYIKKTNKQVEKTSKVSKTLIPSDIDYQKIHNLSLEALEKLEDVRPQNIRQASQISGVNPTDIAVLSIYLKTLEK